MFFRLLQNQFNLLFISYRFYQTAHLQLMDDINANSDNHKQSGHQFGEVRALLHKFYQLASQKAGVQADFVCYSSFKKM